jgi:1-acyl-sn-glycerol-3-phosphate acyltransferase
MIRATLVYLFIGSYILLLAPAGLLWTIISRNDGALLYHLSRFCVRVAGWMGGIRVVVQGREKIIPGGTYVFLSNHQSNLDGPILLHAIPRNWKALIKKEMMRLPLFSLVLKQVRFVPLERLNPRQSHVGIEHAAELISRGNSFLAFPEGTRSRNGSLGSFKKGAFIMAIKAQAPILPVTILDSAAIQPAGRYGIRPGCIRVIFHDPVETQGLGFEERDSLIRRVREAIGSALPSNGIDY